MGIEFRILNFLQGIRTPVGDAVMCFITKLGDAGMIWIVQDIYGGFRWHCIYL